MGPLVCGTDNCSWNPDPNDNWDDCCEDASIPPECLVEEDAIYISQNFTNYGQNDTRQNHVGSCRLFCMRAYPTSTHYTWFSPSYSYSNESHKMCWCMSSLGGRWSFNGTISGELICGGKKSCAFMSPSQGLPNIGLRFRTRN